MNKVVGKSLTEIFKAVADAVDGVFSAEDKNEICRTYLEELKKPEVQAFYGKLIESNPFNDLI